MKLKQIIIPLYITLLYSSMAYAGTLSQTLSKQLQTDDGRKIFNTELRGFLKKNNVIPLSKVPVPGPPDLLSKYVDDERKLIALGKALFWDAQVSSDTTIACATCHNAGGADNRVENTISYGQQRRNPDGSKTDIIYGFAEEGFDANGNKNPQQFFATDTLQRSDFPRNKKVDKFDVLSSFSRETTTIISSSGVHLKKVTGFNLPEIQNDKEFNIDFFNTKINTRRVRGRNVPTNINAVFNHKLLWNGLAHNVFNGVTPFGPEDSRAKVFRIDNGQLEEVKVEIENSALSSQSTGSPNNPFEMANVGIPLGAPGGQNTFIKNAKRRKILDRRPLAKQNVSLDDSVLGSFATEGVNATGLNIKNYRTLIKETFKSKWWSSPNRITLVDGKTPETKGIRRIVPIKETPDGESFSQMDMNFPLFFGLAIAKYESLLISGETPVDAYLAGDDFALTDQELIGLRLAANEARCLNCHGGGEFTFASVSKIKRTGMTRNRGSNLIDEGFNNIGVTPTLADLGIGQPGPKVHINSEGKFEPIILSEARKELLEDTRNQLTLGADGAFKIPTLRNIELTAPYFHNGSESTLEDVVDFYLRGGNYRSTKSLLNVKPTGEPDLDENGTQKISKLAIKAFDRNRKKGILITGLGIIRGPNKDSKIGLNAKDSAVFDDEERDAIVAFLKALTDKRVMKRRTKNDEFS